MSTPHNTANKGDIAKIVLMPGDPLRAKFVAETFLKDVKCFNNVRGMLGFTGKYNGKEVSVMGSGMGCPSMGIYSWELFSFYGVEKIIRIGTTGSYNPNLNLYDVCCTEKSYSESSYAETAFGIKDDILYPSEALNKQLKESAKKQNISLHPVTVYSTDVFYRDREGDTLPNKIKKYSLDVTDMESFALFANAKVLKKQASCILTVSDSLVKNQKTTPAEREKAFTNMMKVALGVLDL